jgi:hypothetical protein
MMKRISGKALFFVHVLATQRAKSRGVVAATAVKV